MWGLLQQEFGASGLLEGVLGAAGSEEGEAGRLEERPECRAVVTLGRSLFSFCMLTPMQLPERLRLALLVSISLPM